MARDTEASLSDSRPWEPLHGVDSKPHSCWHPGRNLEPGGFPLEPSAGHPDSPGGWGCQEAFISGNVPTCHQGCLETYFLKEKLSSQCVLRTESRVIPDGGEKSPRVRGGGEVRSSRCSQCPWTCRQPQTPRSSPHPGGEGISEDTSPRVLPVLGILFCAEWWN